MKSGNEDRLWDQKWVVFVDRWSSFSGKINKRYEGFVLNKDGLHRSMVFVSRFHWIFKGQASKSPEGGNKIFNSKGREYKYESYLHLSILTRKQVWLLLSGRYPMILSLGRLQEPEPSQPRPAHQKLSLKTYHESDKKLEIGSVSLPSLLHSNVAWQCM